MSMDHRCHLQPRWLTQRTQIGYLGTSGQEVANGEVSIIIMHGAITVIHGAISHAWCNQSCMVQSQQCMVQFQSCMVQLQSCTVQSHPCMVQSPGVGACCLLPRGCERLGPFNSYKIATERHQILKIWLSTNFESHISFLALNSCKKVYLNILGVYFCMFMASTATWAHPWQSQIRSHKHGRIQKILENYWRRLFQTRPLS